MLLLALSACRSPATGTNEVINRAPGSLGPGAFHLELEQVFGAEETPVDALIGLPLNAAVDDDGDVYVVDYASSQIIAFDSSGGVRWRAGRAGQGPGEIQQPGELIMDGDAIVLVNQQGARIETFRRDGSLVSSYNRGFKGSGYPNMICSRRPGRVIEATGVPGEWRTVVTDAPIAGVEARQDSTVSVVDASHDVNDALPQLLGPRTTVTCGPTELFIHHPARYLIERWSYTGEYRGAFGRDDTEHEAPIIASIQGGFSMRPVFNAYPVLPVGNGRNLVVAQWMTNTQDIDAIREAMQGGPPAPPSVLVHSLDLYDTEGRLLSTVARDQPLDIGRPFASDGAGRIYTLAGTPFPQVRRYRLVMAD